MVAVVSPRQVLMVHSVTTDLLPLSLPMFTSVEINLCFMIWLCIQYFRESQTFCGKHWNVTPEEKLTLCLFWNVWLRIFIYWEAGTSLTNLPGVMMEIQSAVFSRRAATYRAGIVGRLRNILTLRYSLPVLPWLTQELCRPDLSLAQSKRFHKKSVKPRRKISEYVFSISSGLF